ncbi:MAG: YkgJ family cysteine cluster protein [Simkania sp.]|nr:YkgJ family cysteine cluster protein [Simkania sp.]MCP5491254.1 YkgJ family cysteine cluster protein [Chlamydiales bacterium]
MSDLSLLDDVWYKDGLRFKCTSCGACCTGAPGYVWLEKKDIERLAKRLNLPQDAFLKRYTRQVGSRISLIEDPLSYDCVFLKDKKICTLYEDRPKQCKTFPFWKDVLESPEAWEETKERCEGIDHPDAPCIPLEEIQNQLD